MLSKAEGRTDSAFALVDTDTDRMAGFVDIKSIDWEYPKAELGAFMDAAYEGRGLASKALAAITRYGFRCSGLRQTVAAHA